LKRVVDVVAATVGPHCEVVLHDLRRPASSVVHVANGHVTNRAVNQGIRDLLGVLHSPRFQDDALINYEPAIPLGSRRIRSSTAIFRDSEGTPVAALCMNLDVTEFAHIGTVMEQLASVTEAVSISPQVVNVTTPSDVASMVDQVLVNTIESFGKPVTEMTRADKLEIIEFLADRGAFLTRGAVARTAELLHVSRYAIYKYLQEIKRRRQDGALPGDTDGRPPGEMSPPSSAKGAS
jgi:predicted transcriptional regulator YheO